VRHTRWIVDLPPEVEAKMSKEEIYALQAVPGYFKPQQVSVPQSLLEQGDPQPVKAVVIVDEEMRGYLAWLTYGYWIPELVSWEEVYDWAWNILEGGDDFLEILFGIDMQMVINTNWETPDGWNYHDLLYAIDDVDPRGVGCDILILITGQQDWGLDGLAWCPCPGTPMEGRHFVMDCTVGLTANLFQHEATHLFGPHDHGWNPLIPCIMSYYWTWQLRIYCSACTTNIDQHRFRYD